MHLLAGTGRRGGAVADTVELLGRYQSRQYEKVLDTATGEREQRTAYEVSVRLIRRKEEARNESKSRNE